MTNPKYSVEVYAYDTEVKPVKWTYNHRLRLEFIEGDLNHPDAVELHWPGSEAIVVPLKEFVKAVNWLEQARPR